MCPTPPPQTQTLVYLLDMSPPCIYSYTAYTQLAEFTVKD